MAKVQNKTELFENTPVIKAIATLAVPTALSSLVMVIYSLADTYFVGMINDAAQNAAVAFAGPVLLAFNAVNNLFGVGSSSLMSRALGAKNERLVRESSATGFYSALFLAGLISIFSLLFKPQLMNLLGVTASSLQATSSYLNWTVVCGAIPAILNVVMAYMVRAEGSSLQASIGTMSGCILNMILDPIFILPWGFNMGASGAGLATCLSNMFACSYFIFFVLKRKEKTYVTIVPKYFSFKKSVLLAIFAVGIPAAIQNLLNVTSMTLLNNLTAGYGTEAVAAMGITQKINMVPTQIALGISQGVMPLISYNYASGNINRMKEALLKTVQIALSFLLVITIFYFCGSRLLVHSFMDNEVVVNHGAIMLRNFCIAQPFVVLDFIAVGVFQATGLGQYALVFAILRKIIIEIPALIILNKIWPLYGLSCAQFTSECILGITAIFILRFLFKKWFSQKQQTA